MSWPPTEVTALRLKKMTFGRMLVCWALLCAGLFSAPGASAQSGGRLELEGRGWGHGRGMGQYGALGYALKFGWSHEQILDHFYGGTQKGDIGNPVMSVRMTKFDGRDTLVQQGNGTMLTDAAGGSYSALRVVRIGANTFRVEGGPNCGGPWSTINPSKTGPVDISAPHTDDLKDNIQLCEPSGAVRWVRGNINVFDDGGTTRTVNLPNMQMYLRGVVPRESPASWGDLGGGAGMNALRAQAVAARSYGTAENRAWYAKTCDTTACQVYGGRAVSEGGTFRVLEDPRTDAAIGETLGQARIKNGLAARTEFSSSTGGWTTGGTFPSVRDEGDDISFNPNHYWRTSITASQIQAAWPVIGTFRWAAVTRRNGLGDWGGRVLEIRIEGTSATVVTSGNTFRSFLGLKSDWFNIMSGWEGLGGALTSGPDAASWGANRLDIVAKGTDDGIWQRWWDGTAWGGWFGLGGVAASDPTAISWGANRLDIFVRGTDGGIWQKWWDGQRWNGWQTIGGLATSAPDAASWSSNRIDVVVRGTDNALWHKFWDGRVWSGWNSLGGIANSDPTVVSWGPNRLDVFVRGTDNAVWQKFWDGRAWSGWSSLGGSLAGGLDASSWDSGRIDLFARGSDGGLIHNWYDGGRWNFWEPLGAPVTSAGGTLGSDPTAVSWGPGRIDVFTRGEDSVLWHKWYDGAWRP